MTRLMTTAAVLLALIAPVSASYILPPEWLGKWCPNGDGSDYKRGQCESDAQLTIYPNRYEGPEFGCEWTRSAKPSRIGKFTTGAKCEGDGHPYKANIIIFYGNNSENGYWLSLIENKCSGKKCWK